VDSVFLSFWAHVHNAGNKGTIELYNITDSVPIAGSLIEVHANNQPMLYQSTNITKNFPRKEITLGLRLKGENDGQLIELIKPCLFLYRK
jgi:hypothetical protein